MSLTGCGDGAVNGSVYVVTKGGQGVKMAGVTVLALKEADLREAMEECTTRLEREFPPFQEQINAGMPDATAKDTARNQTILQLKRDIKRHDDEIRGLNREIHGKFGAGISLSRHLLRDGLNLVDLTDADPNDDAYAAELKKRLINYMRLSANDLTESAKLAFMREQRLAAQKTYQQVATLYKIAMPELEAADRKIAPLQALNDDLRSRLEAALSETSGGSHAEDLKRTTRAAWYARQAKIIAETVGTDKRARRTFQTVSTDADGHFSFILPKGGDYAFIAWGSRQVGDNAENYFWFTHSHVSSGSASTLNLDNDQLVSAQSEGGQDQLVSLLKDKYGLYAPSL